MFETTNVFSSFAVGDIPEAKRFYGEVLGLPVEDATLGMPGARLPLGLRIGVGGGAQVLVYPRPNHVPAPFTILNLVVPDIEAAVDELTSRGVRFEHYSVRPQTDGKGIHRDPSVHATAWFTDPSGNVLSLIEA
jgi:catechol 2,3-dioxygenase-like lactoylglutathione lyase family enzyme